MHGLALLSTLAAALLSGVSASPLQDRAAAKQFKLQTEVVNGPAKFGKLWVEPFHTGAAQNAATVQPKKSDSVDFIYNKTEHSISTPLGPQGSAYPYSISLDSSHPYNSTAPSQYKYVAINVGYAGGFSLNKASEVAYSGKKSFGTFAVCHVNGIAPYQSVGPEDQLLWRSSSSKPSASCADVVLKAIY